MTLISIRDDFIQKITEATEKAMGAYVVLQLGIKQHQSFSNPYLSAPISVMVGHPNNPGRTIKYAPTHQQTQSMLQNNPNILLELFLTEIIQYWFDFLLAIYTEVLEANLLNNSNSNYPIPDAKLKVNLSLSGVNLSQNIKDTACKDFDFLKASDKLKIITKALNKNLSTITIDVTLLKTNIQVRNILQHRNGIVNQKDLSDLGIASIDEDHGNLPKSIVAGQKITRTPFDLENLTDSLINIAKTLIP